MEENFYICGWRRSRNGFVVWLKSRRKLTAVAPTCHEAAERLAEKIRAEGVICPFLEFDPPFPKSALEERYSNPELFLIAGDEGFEAVLPRLRPRYRETRQELAARMKWQDEAKEKWENALFESPICPKCNYATSARSRRLPVFDDAPYGYDGGFTCVREMNLQIVSEGFIKLLSAEERRVLAFQPVQRSGKGRSYYELIGPSGLSFVAVAGRDPSGWRCVTCGHRQWGYSPLDPNPMTSYIAKSDLPENSLGVFTVGTAPNIQLAATAGRWREMVGKKGTRGFLSTRLGVVPDSELVRVPELPTREEVSRNPQWNRLTPS